MKNLFTYILTILATCFLYSASYSQQLKIDSLRTQLKSASQDTVKVRLMIEMASCNSSLPEEEVLNYGNNAIVLAKKTNNTQFYLSVLNEYSVILLQQSQYEKAQIYLLELYDLALSGQNKKFMSLALNNLSILYRQIDYYDKALEYNLKALALKKDIGEPRGIAITLIENGIIHFNLSNYPKALESYLSALSIMEDIDDKKGIAIISGNLGNLYSAQKDKENALTYYYQALRIAKEIGNLEGACICLNNIGTIFLEYGYYDKAKENFESSILIAEQNGFLSLKAVYLMNLGKVFMETGDFNSAINYFYSSFEISESIEDLKGMSTVMESIGELYFSKADYQNALPSFFSALKISIQIKNIRLQYRICKSIANTYAEMNDFSNAYTYSKECIVLNDSIFSEDKTKQLADMQVKYNTDKKEKENQILHKNNTIKELEIRKQTLLKNIYLAGIILLILFIAIFIYIYISKTKASKLLLKQNIEITKTEKELIKSKELVNSLGNNINVKLNFLENDAKTDTLNNNANKYTSSNLTDETREILAKKIITQIEEDKVFLHQDLTIEKFAAILETNRSYLSQIINDYYNKSFNNFINELRVKEARLLLSDSKYDYYSIEGIALSVGFNSKSSFNRAFRKHTGVSPSEFQKEIKSS